MENNTSFNNSQTDGLNELMNMGLKSSAEILSKLLNNSVELGTNALNQEKIYGLESFGDAPGIVVGFEISGAVNGKTAVLVQNIYVKEILNVLMNVDEDEQSDDEDELDEISMDTFKELTGQMVAAFSETITNFLGANVNIKPVWVSDLSEECEEVAEFFGCETDDEIYSFVNSFLITDVLSGNFIILNDENTLTNVIRRIMNPNDTSYYDDQNPMMNGMQNSGQSVSVVKNSSLNVQNASFPNFGNNGTTGGIPLLQGNMDLLMDVPLNVTIEIGKTCKRMREIMEFTQGTIIDLEKQAGAPVDVVVNGQLIARGDVVVIDDNFGVRITEIISNTNLFDKK